MKNYLKGLQLFQKQNLSVALGLGFDAKKPSWDNLGVIADENIAFMKIIEDVIEALMLDGLILAVDHQKAAMVTLFHRRLSDKFFG